MPPTLPSGSKHRWLNVHLHVVVELAQETDALLWAGEKFIICHLYQMLFYVAFQANICFLLRWLHFQWCFLNVRWELCWHWKLDFLLLAGLCGLGLLQLHCRGFIISLLQAFMDHWGIELSGWGFFNFNIISLLKGFVSIFYHMFCPLATHRERNFRPFFPFSVDILY